MRLLRGLRAVYCLLLVDSTERNVTGVAHAAYSRSIFSVSEYEYVELSAKFGPVVVLLVCPKRSQVLEGFQHIREPQVSVLREESTYEVLLQVDGFTFHGDNEGRPHQQVSSWAVGR